ncbi:ABC transporter substrate-binding protein [Flammeovirga aprica]|uniref:ABC transporter substrate-binding protein n=1 Tax=Flammeovirga aprica JL-4 TaxID=694437 RepID=A0A7X9P3F1_9BACT|nr:ABC transporter substrate-binding protein [Flammeovirga aprica]NME67707.1 ABC transporter substrate-binding protein [Flammeovirga aprica JL-4]
MRYFYTLILTFLFSFNALAQGGKTEVEKYTYGKQLIDQGKYQPAIVVLQDMMTLKGVTLQPYAYTLIGYAYYQEGNFIEAQNNLNKAITDYADWDEKEQAKYLLGCSYLKAKKYDESLMTVNGITDKKLRQELNTMIFQELEELSIEELKPICEANTENEDIATLLFDKILQQPKEERDQELLTKLSVHLGIEINKHVVKKSEKKDKYTVAVVLPFFTETTDGNALRVKNEFVYNIYQGILIGQEYLAKRDVNIDIIAYDTKRDTTHLSALLEDPKMMNVDLIIGPLYADMLPIVKKFSNETGIPMVNPISSNSAVIEDASNAFITSSTPETIGKSLGKRLRAEELATLEQFPEGDSLRIQADTVQTYVVFGHSTKEKQMAAAFKEAYEAEGGKIAAYQEFDPVDGFNVVQEMFQPLAYDDSLEVVKDSTAHVFISVVNEVEALSTVSALLSLGTVASAYVPQEWLKYNQLSYSQMETAQINILYPNWFDDDSFRAKTFIAEYQEKFNNQPSGFVYNGFETMFAFGMILNDYGNGFVQKLRSSDEFRKGYLTPAYNYKNAQDNQYVPIIQFIDGDLKNKTPLEEAVN